MRNILVVLSGPSGVGKGTIAKEIIRRRADTVLSVSCTTRAPREGEKDGREYFFITREAFEKKIADGGFLEYSEHFGNFYGTPKDFVNDCLKNKSVLLEIDVNGGLNVRRAHDGETVLIMVVPPSIEEVRHRLKMRNTESEEQIELRMERIKYELGKAPEYDYSVVNDDLETTISEVMRIIDEETNK